MKKKFLSLAAVAIVAVAATIGVSKNANKVELSDLALANVEALAYGEQGGGGSYSAVTGEEYVNGTFSRTKDSNGRCIFKNLINIQRAGDCHM